MSLLSVVHGRGTTAAKPAAAAANEGYIYFDTDLVKLQRSNGTTWEDIAETTAGSVATDAIWDAAGDLVQGTGANTAAKLSAGTAGQVLKSAGAAAANVWSSPGDFVTGVDSVATSQTTTSTSFADLATVGPSVAVTVGATGKVKVTLSCRLKNTGANDCYVGIVVSGASTVAAATYMLQNGTAESEFSRVHVFSGLSTGSTTFKMQYAVAAGTGTFAQRELIVEPVL